MKLVETKCPNCNSNVEVENNRKKIECKYCGTKFLLDDNTVNVKHIRAGGISDEQEFINAETNLNKFKNYEEAYRLYLSLSKRFVDHPEVWIGLLRSITHDFKHKINSDIFEKNCTTYWNNFCSLVDRKEISEYLEKYRDYLEAVDAINLDGTLANSNFNNIDTQPKISQSVKQTTVKEESCLLLVTILLGAYGVHKFIRGKIVLGLVYLFTGGLFGIGWIYDIIQEYRKFPESGQRKAIQWVFAVLFFLSALTAIEYSFLAFLFFAVTGILCLDFIWNKLNYNKTWVRILAPFVCLIITLNFTSQPIPETTYGKWVTTDDVPYRIIELSENDVKLYNDKTEKYVSTNSYYYNGIISLDDGYDIELNLEYDSSSEILCLLDDNRCIARYYLVDEDTEQE